MGIWGIGKWLYSCRTVEFDTPFMPKHIEAETKWTPFADDIFKCIFLNDNVWFPIKISLKFVPKGRINNSPALVQIMAWRRPGDKQLSEPMMVSLPTHICVARPKWVNFNVDLVKKNPKIWHIQLCSWIESIHLV